MVQLPEGAILCTIDVVGLYPNILHEEGLASLRKFLDARTKKKVTTEILLELVEIVLKNNVFQFNGKTLKQLSSTAIGTKFTPPYTNIFMADLEERILKDIELQLRIWYIDGIFFIWEHIEDSLKQFIETLNACHPTIKFTAEWSKEKINFLDFNIKLRNTKIETDLHIKPLLNIEVDRIRTWIDDKGTKQIRVSCKSYALKGQMDGNSDISGIVF